jgi:hypothetical protein
MWLKLWLSSVLMSMLIAPVCLALICFLIIKDFLLSLSLSLFFFFTINFELREMRFMLNYYCNAWVNGLIFWECVEFC